LTDALVFEICDAVLFVAVFSAAPAITHEKRVPKTKIDIINTGKYFFNLSTSF